MKRTLNVNIGTIAFTIDEDAYYTLGNYYDDINSRLYESERKEIMEDIESRTADIFRENLACPSQVVSIDLVKRAIAIIGSAQTFGEQRYDPGYEAPEANPPRKLYRSRTNNVIGGICGGLAEYFGIDATLLRVLLVVSIFISFSVTFWIYIIMWIVVPLEPRRILDGRNRKMREDK